MSNLLEKASILLTPTAYDDGKMLSVKPEEVLGEEKIVNGTFDENVNGWITNNANASFVWQINKTALFTSTSFAYVKVSPTLNLNAAVYKVSFDILSFEGTLSNVHIGLGSSGNTITTTGSYTYFYTSTGGSTEFQIRPNSGGTGSITIDNVSVKEDISGDFDFTRNSSATRVNSQGLIEDVQILSSNLVSNGDFSQEGSEEVTNGDFATDSDWNKGSNWSILNGVATSNGSGLIQQSTSELTSGKTYKISFEITEYTSGGVKLYSGSGSDASTYKNTVGTHTDTLVLNGSTTSLYSNNFIGSIDNVSVKEVGQDWTLGTGWSIGANKAIATDAAFGAQLVDDTTLVANKKYKVTFDISDYVKGNVRVGVGNVFSSEVSSNGSFTFIITSSNTNAFKAQTRAGGSGTTLSISNISVIEITDDTNLPRINYEGFSYQDSLGSELVTNGDFSDGTNGWNAAGGGSISVSNNQLTLEGNNDFNFYARQTVLGYEVGKQYRIEVDVAGGSTSKMQVGIYGEGLLFDNQPIVLGKLSAIFTITSGSNGSRFLDISNRNDDGLNDTLIINSVSVKEYLGQEVVPDSGRGSWLFEPQSTNIITYSEVYGSGTYFSSFQGSTFDNTTSLSPSGENNATQLTSTGDGKLQTTAISLPQNTDYTLSFYAKNVDATAVTSRVLGLGGSGGSNLIPISYFSELSTTEWKRITHSFNTGTNTTFYLYLSNALNSGGTIQLWGAQLEQNSFATSYIPTNGSTVTRLADAAFGAGSSDLINSTEGVLYAEIAALANGDINRVISISDETNDNLIFLRFDNSVNRVRGFARGGGGAYSILTINGVTQTDNNKIALVWNASNFKMWVNGVERGTTAINSVPSNINTVKFTNPTSGENFFGKTKCLAVFKEALTDAELTCLTTI